MLPFGALYKKSAAIAFVPPNFVHVSWDGLNTEMPDDERLESYATYIDQTWMNGNFRPRMWNYYAQRSKSNYLEGWHNRMKRILRRAHPNLYEMLELFQREQAATEVTIQQLEAGGVCKSKRKIIQWEEKIKSLAEELANGDRDMDSYLTAIRHCVVSFDFKVHCTTFFILVFLSTFHTVDCLLHSIFDTVN